MDRVISFIRNGKTETIQFNKLKNADLSEANLSEADFFKANLSKANLAGANLVKTNLSGANLVKTNIDGANLYRADLSEANLSGADLYRANLSGIIICGANGIIDAGQDSRGYRFLGVKQETGYRILAGCRWFTPEEAQKHWGEKNNQDALLRCELIANLIDK